MAAWAKLYRRQQPRLENLQHYYWAIDGKFAYGQAVLSTKLGQFDSKAKFLATASMFEELGVKAYHGQVTMIQDKTILGAAASIAGVESRHAAILNDLLGQKQVPAPIEGTATIAETVQTVTPFLGS